MSVGVDKNDGSVLVAGLRVSRPEIPATLALRRKLSPESKMQADIERRRKAEAERKKRIFDTKFRLIGVDKNALDAQVLDKQERRKNEKNAQLSAEKQMLYFSSILDLQEREAQRLRREREKEAKGISLKQFKKEAQTGFDLNEPASLYTTNWNEVENNHLVGVSSLLKFDGEDPSHDARAQQQRRQQRRWAEEQQFERELQRHNEKEADKIFSQQALKNDSLAEALERNRLQNLRSKEVATAEANKELADERAERERQKLAEDNLVKAKDVWHNMHCPILAEGKMNYITDDPSYTHMSSLMRTGALGRNRDGFKGLDPAVKQNILNSNVEEWRKCEKRREIERQAQQEWDRQSEVTRKVAVALQRRQDQSRRQLQEHTQKVNLALSAAHTKQMINLYNVTYAGGLTEDYFKHFGTTTR